MYATDGKQDGRLGRWWGSKDPGHIARWVAAQNAGLRNAPKCEAVSKGTGRRCQHVVRRGSTLCFTHATGIEKDRLDTRHEKRMLKWLEKGSPWQRQKALKSLGRIARRRIYRLWKLDPGKPVIDLLELAPADEQAVANWLWSRHRINLDKNLPQSDHHPTARCRDRLRYAAWRVIARGSAASPEFIKKADHRVSAALRDDQLFREKTDAPCTSF